MYFVYILHCKDDSLYIGISTDPARRLIEHQNGKGGAYTRSHKPEKIVYMEMAVDKSAALRREIQLKSWSKTKKVALIKSQAS
jgi:putative endonuclease